MLESDLQLGLLILIVLAVIGAGEDPNPTSTSIKTSVKPSVLRELEDNELTVTFQPLDDVIYSSDAPQKYFGTDNNTVVTSQVGSTALIPCVIHNIGDGIVSWIRRKDYHLLTVGLTTYSSDQRFQAIHLQHSEDWTLKVRFVQKRDAGIFECQVSSHPPTSIFLRLDVVEARAQIAGPTEKYLKPGSTLRLQCSVVQTTEAPAFVFWYHNNRMINYDVERGVNVTTDPVQRVSDLHIPTTTSTHAGNYSCVPNNAVPASIYVHIFNGENPAAMQSNAANFWTLFKWQILFILIVSLNVINFS